MKLFIAAIFLICNFSYAGTTVGDGADQKDVIAISKILESPEKYLDKEVTVEGTVVKVCERTGCKMKLASDKEYQDLMIRTKSKTMTFPLSARGKKAVAKGIFTRFAKRKDHEDCDESYSYVVLATGATILE